MFDSRRASTKNVSMENGQQCATTPSSVMTREEGMKKKKSNYNKTSKKVSGTGDLLLLFSSLFRGYFVLN